MEPTARPSFRPAAAGGVLLGVLVATIAIGALVGWLLGSIGYGFLIGAIVGVPLAILSVYLTYRGSI